MWYPTGMPQMAMPPAPPSMVPPHPAPPGSSQSRAPPPPGMPPPPMGMPPRAPYGPPMGKLLSFEYSLLNKALGKQLINTFSLLMWGTAILGARASHI